MMIPVAFIIVIGNTALGNLALVDPKTMFITFASKVFGAGAGSTCLTAGRDDADHGADAVGAERDHRHGALAAPDVDDGQFPRFFQKVNTTESRTAR